MDIHNNERKEVLKCWRLHLGSSDILKKVVEYTEYNGYSADNPGTFIRFYNQCLSWKNACRKWRESSDTCCYSEEKPNCFNSCFDKVYTLYNMFYYALRPFLGVSALYFDICKDITFAILIYTEWYSKLTIWFVVSRSCIFKQLTSRARKSAKSCHFRLTC